MQTEELQDLLDRLEQNQCEHQRLELKAAHTGCPKRLYNTLSSFSNQDTGGIILFGVDERTSCSVVGVYDPQDLIQRVTEQCRQMEPPVRAVFTVLSGDGGTVVSAEIPGADPVLRPVYYRGRGKVRGSYIRVGDADEIMTDYELYSLEAYRRHIRDDIRPIDRPEAAYFDNAGLENFLKAVRRGKPNLSGFEDRRIMSLLGILSPEGTPSLAGVLCFSDYPQACFPQLMVTAVVVPGTVMGETGEGAERFLANQRIEGTISQMTEGTLAFLQRNMKTRTVIDDHGRRKDRYEYPVIALREIILNALMHRDYSIHTEGAPVRVVLYNDRIEISSPGGLYGSLTVEALGRAMSVSRNPALALLLETMDIVENRNSGIATIIHEMDEAHLPPPEFINERGTFTVILRNEAPPFDKKHARSRKAIISYCSEPRTRDEIAGFLGLTPYYAMNRYVTPLIEDGEIRELVVGEGKPLYRSR